MDDLRLNRDRIIAEALVLLNEAGLDGLSLRPLAARLGVKAPSLYWYVPDKNALLAGLNEFVFTRCIKAAPQSSNWRVWMRGFGEVLWQAQNEVRDFGRLTTTVNIDEPQFSRTMGLIRAHLAGLDMALAEAEALQSAVQALITGWAVIAHAPYSAVLAQAIDFDRAAMDSLDALIEGWPLRKPLDTESTSLKTA